MQSRRGAPVIAHNCSVTFGNFWLEESCRIFHVRAGSNWFLTCELAAFIPSMSEHSNQVSFVFTHWTANWWTVETCRVPTCAVFASFGTQHSKMSFFVLRQCTINDLNIRNRSFMFTHRTVNELTFITEFLRSCATSATLTSKYSKRSS